MTTYELQPMPDADRVWLVNEPERIFVRAGDPGYAEMDTAATAERLRHFYWGELLALGPVTDVDPDDPSWLPPGPWVAVGNDVRSLGDQQVLTVNVRRDSIDVDDKIAALVARLVNEHVARRAKGGA